MWRNCYECEEEESSRWWEQLQQNYENQSMCGHVGQPTNYSLMNEVYKTERIVSIQSEDGEDVVLMTMKQDSTGLDMYHCYFDSLIVKLINHNKTNDDNTMVVTWKPSIVR